ncbi:MAG: helix-turn-helix domain-containing protein, partial [Frankiaceae bacterium]
MNDRDPSTALGETIRAQRQRSQLPMRTLAERVGISNPYLSQIERGLRAPSDQVLDSIARALKTTSRALYEAAGLTPPGQEADDVPDPPVLIALREDTLLSDNQRRALAAVYRAFTEGKAQKRRRRRRRLAAAPAAVAAAAEA